MIPGTLRGITAPGKFTPYPIVSQAYLDRNLVLILQFHQFHTERNYKSVNIGTCDILKMTARTDAGLQTVAITLRYRFITSRLVIFIL